MQTVQRLWTDAAARDKNGKILSFLPHFILYLSPGHRKYCWPETEIHELMKIKPQSDIIDWLLKLFI